VLRTSRSTRLLNFLGVLLIALSVAPAFAATHANPETALGADSGSGDNLPGGVLRPTPAHAHGFYVAAGYAMVYAPDESLGITPAANTLAPSDDSLWLDYDLGFRSVSLSAGYAFHNGIRAELEASYRRNELEVLDFSDNRGTLNTGASDAVDTLTGFANLYYDFKPKIAVQPYLGAGVGVADTRYRTSFSTRIDFTRFETPLFNERDTTLAWQVIAGASTPITPRTRLSAEYRYWQSAKINFTDAMGSRYQTHHKLHMAGLKLQFFPAQQRPIYDSRQTRAAVTDRNTAYGLYFAARAGVLAAEDSDLDNPVREFEDTNFDAFDLGPMGALALGYAFDPQHASLRGWPLRTELEANFFTNDTDVVDFGKLPGEFRLDGPVKVRALALNLLTQPERRAGLAPYVGIGIGYANVDYQVEVLDADNSGQPQPNSRVTLVDDRAGGITIQGLLGVSVALRNNLQLELGYRYWWAPRVRLRGPAGERLNTEHSAHAIHIGLRFDGLTQLFRAKSAHSNRSLNPPN